MATHAPSPISLRGSKWTSPRIESSQLITPVHSPHHSVTSPVSYRTPNHTLTIHEYRKQQQTPALQSGTPPGKTLRRKAALTTLGDLERAPPLLRAEPAVSSPSLHQLHFSQSAQQLNTSLPLFQQPTLSALALRSQSAEPRVQAGSISSASTVNSQGKVRYFKSRKRLPKPPAATGPSSYFPLFANVISADHRYSPLPTNLSFSPVSIQSSDAPDTTNSSTFSLSQFPKPPHLIDLSFSPPRDEENLIDVNPITYATTAPETPPATPAIIHYRGVSFDLVNPRASLLLHDIVTPSKEYESIEYLPLPSPEDPILASSEMAPKRALYGDVSAARAGIMKRPEDSLSEDQSDILIPPTPAAISPNSSSYTSPMYSPEPVHVPVPLTIKKTVRHSRFSLRQLTRTLTKKLGNDTFEDHELQDIRNNSISLASNDTNDQYSQALPHSNVSVPQPTYFPMNAMSPLTPTSPTFPEELEALHTEETELPFRTPTLTNYKNVKPLTSMIPDDSTMQMGRMGAPQSTISEIDVPSKPYYYDDGDSLYASSSVYTRDDPEKSKPRQSVASYRQSNPFVRYSGVDTSSFANARDSLCLYNQDDFAREDEQTRTSATRDSYRLNNQEDAGADTISKLIENYRPHALSTNSSSARKSETAGFELAPYSNSFDRYDTYEPPLATDEASSKVQLNFDLDRTGEQYGDHKAISPFGDAHEHGTMRNRNIGSPPREMAPPAPSFEYDEIPFLNRRYDLSEMFSTMSSCSYGETRNLLQITHSNPPEPHIPVLGLEASSSYSQPEGSPFGFSSSNSQRVEVSPRPPQEALDQAEQIFEDAATKSQQQNDEIPAIWARRSSVSLLRNKKRNKRSRANIPDGVDSTAAAGDEEDKADWETLAENSQDGRNSLDSIANYSSGEESCTEFRIQSQRSFLSPAHQDFSQNPSSFVFPSPVRSPLQNSASSPPDFKMHADIPTSSEDFSPWIASSPPVSRTAPLFHQPENTIRKGAVSDLHDWTPRTNPYAFSEKETLELLASGPNEDIIIEKEYDRSAERPSMGHEHNKNFKAQKTTSTKNVPSSTYEIERENTFEKFSVVGLKGNLTGTPNGTGMNETGSSVADTSSPTSRLNSSVDRSNFHTNYAGFYASPFPATGSITRIHGPSVIPQQEPEPVHDRGRSHPTIFLRGKDGIEEIEVTKELPHTSPRLPLHNPPQFKRTHRPSRAAVPGQTKLRQMVLATDVRSTSSHDTTFSRFIDASGRPSTSDTITPLRPTYNHSIGTLPLPYRSAVAHQHSPHLLCLERAANPDDESRRRKLSWVILVPFFLIPPLILLYRCLGDSIITSLTNGRLRYCTAQSKRVALIAGISVNIGLVTAILVPVFIAYAVKIG